MPHDFVEIILALVIFFIRQGQTRSMKLNQTLMQPTAASAQSLEFVHPGGERIPNQPRVQAINQGENCSTEAEWSVCEVRSGVPVDEQIACVDEQLQTFEIGRDGN
jgi:hypothetical protein